MGCDIHFYTERFTSSNDYEGPRDISKDRNNKIEEIVDGRPSTERWVSADKWVKMPPSEDDSWAVDWNDHYYGGRNYGLFSILADVRGDEVPIDLPRGIPSDASAGYRYMCERWDGDAHSHSYFTLEELLKVDWSKYESDYVSEFLETIESMKDIDRDPSKIRCCFFFDN